MSAKLPIGSVELRSCESSQGLVLEWLLVAVPQSSRVSRGSMNVITGESVGNADGARDCCP